MGISTSTSTSPRHLKFSCPRSELAPFPTQPCSSSWRPYLDGRHPIHPVAKPGNWNLLPPLPPACLTPSPRSLPLKQPLASYLSSLLTSGSCTARIYVKARRKEMARTNVLGGPHLQPCPFLSSSGSPSPSSHLSILTTLAGLRPYLIRTGLSLVLPLLCARSRAQAQQSSFPSFPVLSTEMPCSPLPGKHPLPLQSSGSTGF